MDDDLRESDLERRVPMRLVEWRIKKLEEGFDAMTLRIEKLATRADVQKVETKIDEAAEKKSDRSFAFWMSALAGPVISGIVVGIVLFALLHQQSAGAVSGH